MYEIIIGIGGVIAGIIIASAAIVIIPAIREMSRKSAIRKAWMKRFTVYK